MINALVVSNIQKNVSFISEVLHAAGINLLNTLHSIGEARRYFPEHDVDLVIVDSPLHDESGEIFARDTAVKSQTQVILVVQSEHFNSMASVCEKDGVLTISKPINREVFWSVLSLAKALDARMKRIHEENAKLKQKIEDIRVIDRAKCLLISYVNLSEQEAHRFIEKQAMDLRSSKVSIALEIIRTYGN